MLATGKLKVDWTDANFSSRHATVIAFFATRFIKTNAPQRASCSLLLCGAFELSEPVASTDPTRKMMNASGGLALAFAVYVEDG